MPRPLILAATLLTGVAGALVLPSISSDGGDRPELPPAADQLIDDLGAVQPAGRCAPQFIIRVPDFPEADHVSASRVTVDFSDARICSDAPPATVPAMPLRRP